MALDADVLAGIREHVGSTPADGDLETRYDRHGSVARVALEVIRERLADVLANPASLSVDGDYTEGWTANIRALERKQTQLEQLVAEENDAQALPVAHLTRADRRR